MTASCTSMYSAHVATQDGWRASLCRRGSHHGSAAGRMLPVLLLLALSVAACNPYMAAVSAVSATYGVATDVRPVDVQVSDDEIEAEIKAALLESPVAGTGSLTAYCRQGVVVLLGVVPPGSDAGHAAVELARHTSGVVRVETFFVSSRPSTEDDLELEAKVKAAFVEDPNLLARRVSVNVFGGHVVLVGVVDTEAQADEFVADARAVPGVMSVRSYIQLPQ
jgi:osmotically-inducible protein OsmY